MSGEALQQHSLIANSLQLQFAKGPAPGMPAAGVPSRVALLFAMASAAGKTRTHYFAVGMTARYEVTEKQPG